MTLPYTHTQVAAAIDSMRVYLAHEVRPDAAAEAEARKVIDWAHERQFCFRGSYTQVEWTEYGLAWYAVSIMVQTMKGYLIEKGETLSKEVADKLNHWFAAMVDKAEEDFHYALQIQLYWNKQVDNPTVFLRDELLKPLGWSGVESRDMTAYNAFALMDSAGLHNPIYK